MRKQLDLEDYQIIFGPLGDELTDLTARNSSRFVLVDSNTKEHCLPLLDELPDFSYDGIIEIEPGEEHKTLTTCERIWKALFDERADRSSVLINLGGGVIGDMGGFVASTYMRGIDFIQVPTTLLSQVDASVGGKLGVDFNGLKNSVGLFKNPSAVLIDSDFLNTLPLDELRSGYAEVLKHALIRDRQKWDVLTQSSLKDLSDWTEIIHHSVGIKHAIVEADPFEKGERKLLNFGHTIGHAIESVLLPTDAKLLHGEAIAIGMICEGFLSVAKDMLDKEKLDNMATYLLQTYGKITLDKALDHAFFERMKGDKKNVDRQINFTLLADLGHGVVNQTADVELIQNALDYYRQLSL